MASTSAVHIVDDDDAVRDSMAVLLETHGLEVTTYASAREFLQRTEGVAGCLVTDVEMAETNGLELLRALKARDPDFPVIIVTARAEPGLAAKAVAHGAVAFLEKPFAPHVLLAAIREALA